MQSRDLTHRAGHLDVLESRPKNPTQLLDKWWYSLHQLEPHHVPEFRSVLLDHVHGRFYSHKNGSEKGFRLVCGNTPSIIVAGPHRSGKSSLINSILAAFHEGWYAHAETGTPEIAGTLRFQGPFSVRDLRTNTPKAMFFDTEGFSSDYGAIARHRLVVKLLLGEAKIGDALISADDDDDDDDDQDGGRVRRRRNSKRNSGKKNFERAKLFDFCGADLVVIVHSAADERGLETTVKEALKFERLLRNDCISSMLVFTHVDDKVRDQLCKLMEKHPPNWYAIENYRETNVGGMKVPPTLTDERNLALLRLYARMLLTIEEAHPVVPTRSRRTRLWLWTLGVCVLLLVALLFLLWKYFGHSIQAWALPRISG